MTDINKARQLHRLLDKVADSQVLDSCDIAHLRATLPELPKQKTLEELRREVYDGWVGTNGDEWPDDVHGELETWLAELHAQLQGLKDTPATVPALPTGMRIADHGVFGRVVVSPEVDMDDCYEIYHLAPGMSSGTDLSGVGPNSLTFIDSEPAEPAHPEFLETEADYAAAPDGTIVASAENLPCHKFQSNWSSVDFIEMKDDKGMSRFSRRVLRWGWGE